VCSFHLFSDVVVVVVIGGVAHDTVSRAGARCSRLYYFFLIIILLGLGSAVGAGGVYKFSTQMSKVETKN
jgi:hypothetical protein